MKSLWKKLLLKVITVAVDLFVKYFEEKEVPIHFEYESDRNIAGGLQLVYKKLGSTTEEQWKFLKDVAKLIKYIETLPGYTVTGGELFRTPEQQAIYIAKGLSKTSNSKHLKRLAIDLNLFINGEYQTTREPYKPLAKFWNKLSPENKAGYDWGWDANHFERSV